MIRLLVVALLVLAGLLAGPQLVQYKGYVMISVADYTIETSLVALVLIALVAFTALQLLEWGFIKLVQATGATLLMPKRWRRRQAKKHTLTGILALAEQDWPRAEKAMLKGANEGEIPLFNYFAAARAAHHRGDSEAWQQHLEQAGKLEGAEATAQITRIRYLLDDGELESARQLYDQLDVVIKHKPAVLRLALALFRAQQDWDALARLIPLLKRDRSLPAETLAELPIEAEQARFNACETFDGVKAVWDGLKRPMKKAPQLQLAYAEALLRLQQPEKSRSFILDKLVDPAEQAPLLALLVDASKGASEEVANILKRKFPDNNDPALQSCLGALAKQRNQFELALKHYQLALDSEPSLARYQQVIRLQEALNRNDKALSNYRKMLTLMQAS
ncbi:heme biosynthesis HemY N-terminal domain-containing protein [Ferrimonas senticii]|uniref:heme biosynthesis HemY N-terminal domain-containing protein n=1 Tax=Ferrimonas senticii TaxID=394566 RepID=UPI0003FD1AE2|nr:heme biosynthesis HemY N-terminal domain-containing protein [Ferrimonas senticii]